MIRNRVKWLIRLCDEMGLDANDEKVKASIVAISMNDKLNDLELEEAFFSACQSRAVAFMHALQTTDEFNAIVKIVDQQLLSEPCNKKMNVTL
ncbi:hypothetical protein [Photobacterium kagoshimensis]|uniref:hypothetical protein n=1 Tax=Photobacterium kagoshimensis TaxID=2910242 RepID=UPI003D0CC163